MKYRFRFLWPLFLLPLVNDGMAQILPSDAMVERLATGFSFTEGPVYRDGAVLFTAVRRSDIIRYDITTGATESLDSNSGGANGLFYDGSGQLITMDGNAGRVARGSANDVSKIEAVLSDEWGGVRFNSPNDIEHVSP